MTRTQLEHAIRAACTVSDDTEVWVFGSQAILGTFPKPPESLTASIEVDVQPKNHPETADFVEGSLGELSMFHSTHGFYVHFVPVESATLPVGWRSRAVPVVSRLGDQVSTGWCLEAHDLAVSKLAAGRPKDRDFVRTMIVERMIDTSHLLARLDSTSLSDASLARISTWIRLTDADR